MRKTFAVFIMLFTALNLFAANPAYQPATHPARVPSQQTTNQQQVMIYALTHHLTVRQYQQLNGQKLTLKQKVTYILLKNKLIKASGDNKTGVIIGGFLLGLLLGPIGVLIVFVSSKNKTFRNWSLLGLIGWGVALLFFILLAASLGNWN